ncbi:MAG: N-acetyltransferase [Proteobacteria bacterium]|nr:N-acetyltransferase [Pseudomonadota bacterium]
MNEPPPAPTIRDCAEADLAAVQAIYAHHVVHGLASFEEDPPGLAEIRRRWAAVREAGLPYLVAESEGRVLGYAYASPFRARPAYRYALESSVYVAPSSARRGAGRALMRTLIARAEAQGYRQMVAVIGDSANGPSIGLHAALGFRLAGQLRSIGFKHGRWVDTVYMQRPLGAGDSDLPR